MKAIKSLSGGARRGILSFIKESLSGSRNIVVTDRVT